MIFNQSIGLSIELDNPLTLDKEQAIKLTNQICQMIDDSLTSDSDSADEYEIAEEIKAGTHNYLSVEIIYSFDVYERETVEYDEHGYRCTNEVEYDEPYGVRVNEQLLDEKIKEVPELKCEVDGWGIEVSRPYSAC